MAGASSQRDDEIVSDINVTPLVDVCLVLVIIFMAVAPFAVQAGIKVLESKSKTAEGKSSASENVQIRLTVDGRLTVNGKPFELSFLAAAVADALAASQDKMVIITADDANKVGQVVEVLDTAKQAGAVKLAIMRNEAPPATVDGAAEGT